MKRRLTYLASVFWSSIAVAKCVLKKILLFVKGKTAF